MTANICRKFAAYALVAALTATGLTSCHELPTNVPPPVVPPPAAPPPPANPLPPLGQVLIITQVHGLDYPVTAVLEVDFGSNIRKQIFLGDTVLIDLPPGDHSIGIASLTSNCTKDPGTDQRVTVVKDSTISVRFDIACVVSSGVVRATISTTGFSIDRTGYSARLNGGATAFHVDANGTFFLFPVGGGAQTLTLEGIASNCTLSGDASRSFTITVGGLKRDTIDVAWDLACIRVDKIAFRRFFADPRNPTVVYTANADGSEQTGIWSGFAPAWSPDGEMLAFKLIDCFYYSECFIGGLLTSTLSGQTSLLTTDPRDEDPAWRPTDGAVIAFTRSDTLRLLDAKDRRTITTIPTPLGIRRVSQPSWSPDGTSIAVGCVFDNGAYEICIVNVSTSSFTRITNDAADEDHPAWSPDGSQIAFSYREYGELYIALTSIAGGEIQFLTWGKNPAWSPDGKKLAYEQPPAPGIFAFTLASREIERITSGNDHDPAWHP